MLTLSCVSLAARYAARIGAVAGCSIVMATGIYSAAYAGGIALGGCTGGLTAVNCVVRWGDPGDPYIRAVPPPADAAQRTQAAERDRKWEQRCKPVIAQDRYGVPRYEYAAASCEFGVIE